jgi:hypothetical protein
MERDFKRTFPFALREKGPGDEGLTNHLKLKD